jgi:hypothetical protein
MDDRLTIAAYRESRDISESQFARLKRRVAASAPGVDLVERDGNNYYLLCAALFDAHLRDQRSDDRAHSGGLALRKEAPGVVFGELVDEVVELEIVLPDHSRAIDEAQSQIAQVSHISSGNRNHTRQLRRQALIELARRQAVEDFALQEKAYAATMAQLEQAGINAIGLGKAS